MSTYRKFGVILCVGFCAWRMVACSANTGPSQGIGALTGAGGGFSGFPAAAGGGSGLSGSPTYGAGSGSGTDNPGVFKIKDSGASVRSHDSSCGAVAEVPETITKYIEASITDTIVTYTPVALLIMLDRSGSMVVTAPGQTTDSWTNSVNAVTAFVKDPQSAGLDIGLTTFPYGPNNTADCNAGSDCGMPVVPIASLPNAAQPMIDAMNAQRPQPLSIALTPTECGLRGMINDCLQFQSTSPTGEKCVAVLVTDGTPTQCNVDESALTMIIADGHAKGVDTYTLGLPGSDINVLNQYANAGGTGMAIDVTSGANAFVTALTSIRGKISHKESRTVVHPQVIQTPLRCQWKIPPQKMGDPALDPKLVNLQFTPPNAASFQFGHVDGPNACPATGNAWYFDDEKNPSQVFLCPGTCTNVEGVTGARIDILLHCPRIEAIPA